LINIEARLGNSSNSLFRNGPETRDRRVMVKPNFFLVGAAKAGTTSLYHYLRSHPQIFLCPIKEPNYFAKDIDTTAYLKERRQEPVDINQFLNCDTEMSAHSGHLRRWDDYLALFAKRHSEVAVGECSVSYLVSKLAADKIKTAIPDARIIIILRDPVERAYSHYIMDLIEGAARGGFLQVLARQTKNPPRHWGIVDTSLYYHQVQRYYDAFGRSRVKVVLYEDLKEPDTLMKEIFRYLKVDEKHRADTSQRFNAAKLPPSQMLHYLLNRARLQRLLSKYTPCRIKDFVRSCYYQTAPPSVSPRERERLLEVFHSDTLQLAELIQRNLSAWLL
jgi:hypothetical protein